MGAVRAQCWYMSSVCRTWAHRSSIRNRACPSHCMKDSEFPYSSFLCAMTCSMYVSASCGKECVSVAPSRYAREDIERRLSRTHVRKVRVSSSRNRGIVCPIVTCRALNCPHRSTKGLLPLALGTRYISAVSRGLKGVLPLSPAPSL